MSGLYRLSVTRIEIELPLIFEHPGDFLSLRVEKNWKIRSTKSEIRNKFKIRMIQCLKPVVKNIICK